MQQIFQHTYANGLTLVAERMEHVRSAAFYFLVPAGSIHDPVEQRGVGTVLTELMSRGAGKHGKRELSDALDNLGVSHSESVASIHAYLGGGLIARNLPAALELYADMLRRPHLPEEELEAVQSQALQDLLALEDEPAHKLLLELRQRHYPPPLGQDSHGTEEGIENLDIDAVRRHYRRLYRPNGTILTVAGNIDWEPLKEQVGQLFADWKPSPDPTLNVGKAPGGYVHVEKETTQTQIGIAYPSVPFGHADYYNAYGAVQVLDGGMSARLFTEVREKHGLCYSISAWYEKFKDRASVLCYAGTTTPRAQETLDRTLHELRRLQDGIEEDEVARIRVGMKSSLIKAEESTGSRAGTLASDWFHLGRIRRLDEVRQAIDNLTPASIVEHVRRLPPKDFTIVTLGAESLRI